MSMIFCLIAEPTNCRTLTPVLPEDEPLTWSSCQIAGLQEGAKWADEHPKWRLARIRCSLGNKPPERPV
jgi:hypothetical protein